MIKVNLLSQKRPKRAAADPSSRQLAYGVAALAAVAVLVVLLVDLPQRNRVGELERANTQLQASIAEKNKQLDGYVAMQKEEKDALERAQAINRLMRTKVVPAHVLHELGKILTPNSEPTMTENMSELVRNDSNKRFQTDWDPHHVWLGSFTDKDGAFRLEGGAQSESDVTQLAKRLAASVHFTEVTPAGGQRVVDKERGISYYRFTITGRIVY